MIDDSRITKASYTLLEPYSTDPETPYLSEEQRELSELSFDERIDWMAEWLAMAQDTEE